MPDNRNDLERLDEQLQRIARHIDHEEPEISAAIETYVRRLAAADAGSLAPRPGDIFPEFVLPDIAGRLASSAELIGGAPVVISFLRGHWCPFCQAQSEAFRLAEDAIVDAGASLILITPERAAYAKRLATASPKRRVLCDLDHGLAATLGLMVPVDEPMAALLAAEGLDLPRFQGAVGWAVPIPATFVLKPTGEIVDRFVNPDYRVRMDFNAIFAALQAAQT